MSLILSFLVAVVIGLIFWFWASGMTGSVVETPRPVAPAPAVIMLTPLAPLPPLVMTSTLVEAPLRPFRERERAG